MTQPMIKIPATPVQRAIVARLRGDATLAGLLPPVKDSSPPVPAVVDQPAEGQVYPYIRVGDHLSIADNDLTGFGRQITETLHIWTKTRSNGPGQLIADRAAALLDHQDRALSALLAGDGHRVVRINLEYDQALTDPDPQIRHHVLRFRIVTEQL